MSLVPIPNFFLDGYLDNDKCVDYNLHFPSKIQNFDCGDRDAHKVIGHNNDHKHGDNDSPSHHQYIHLHLD